MCILYILVNGEVQEIEMSKMTDVRMGEIALALLMAKWTADGGVKIGPEWPRTRGQLAKSTGIKPEELDQFSKQVLVRFIGKAYGMQHVGLTMDDPIKPRPDVEVVEL